MKKFVLIALSVLLANGLYAEKRKEVQSNATMYGDCSFKRIEKDADGVFVHFSCGKFGQKKCYVQKDRDGYESVETGDVWQSIDKNRVTFWQSQESGRQEITSRKNGKLEGWFTGDCLIFYNKGKLGAAEKSQFDVIGGKILTAKEDDINLPFVDHPEAIGKWKSVDFVERKNDFDPAKKKWQGDLFFKEIKFSKNGKTNTHLTWTKEVLISPMQKTASKYEIQKIGEKDYMFMEWKSGDYVWRHQNPWYYVLERVVETKKKK